MASASDDPDELFDRVLGHDDDGGTVSWDRNYNKKQCPECGGLHELSAGKCAVCGWTPD